MNQNARMQKIAKFAYTHLQETYSKRSDRERLDHLLYHADYRWQHTLRVSQYGKIIAENEGANVELIVAACLLHDMAWFETGPETSREHGRIAARLARPFLDELGYTAEQAENICYSIAAHVDVDRPETLEARILSDADNVDRFGPYRTLQWCFSDIADYDRLADKMHERIKRLEKYRQRNPLFTSTGKQLFTEQLDLQITFCRTFVGEKELSVMAQV